MKPEPLLITEIEQGYHDTLWSIHINGVKWGFEKTYRSWEKEEILNKIDLSALLNISCYDYEKISLNEAILGTPYIGVRVGKTYHNLGKLTWYDLNDLSIVPIATIRQVRGYK